MLQAAQLICTPNMTRVFKFTKTAVGVLMCMQPTMHLPFRGLSSCVLLLRKVSVVRKALKRLQTGIITQWHQSKPQQLPYSKVLTEYYNTLKFYRVLTELHKLNSIGKNYLI